MDDMKRAVESEYEQPLVLVVDDDPAQRLLLRETLIQADIRVQEGTNGKQAIELFRQISPDMVLMDIKMPVMDGLQACMQMRQWSEGKDVPIVLITGLDDHDSIQQAFEADATDFITKPVNWPILNHRVRYLLKASKALGALRQSENRLSHAQKIAMLGNWEWDIQDNKLHGSEQTFQIFGQSREAFATAYETLMSLVHAEDRNLLSAAIDQSLNKQQPLSVDHRIVLADGSERTVHQEGEVVFSAANQPLLMKGTVQDISKRKMAEQQIRYLAYFDTLTGLPNREQFKDNVGNMLNQAEQEGTKVALMFLDLDEFKRINDSLGHNKGDELLKTIADNLTQGYRAAASLYQFESQISPQNSLYRLGGDEFIILFNGLQSWQQIPVMARQVLDHLNQSIVIHGQEIFATGCMGISLYPDDGNDVDTLLKHADIAMYQAKKEGRDSFQFYSEKQNIHTTERLSLETRLRKALERDELVLHYQPQVSASTGEMMGLEALIRMKDGESGLIPPAQFIALAEESGLILPIGEWVLQTACRQAVSWQQAGYKPLKMSVNISSHQFHQKEFIQMIQGVLDESGLSPELLELEMTESMIMQQVDRTIDDLNRLKQIGLILSIDDFGTGYSSMSYLKRFPLDTLKIDRSFVKDISDNDNDTAIIRAIIALAKSLSLSTIAEGVEQKQQLEFLRDQGCDYIQGYYFSRPVPLAEIEKFLQPQIPQSSHLKTPINA